MTMIALATNAEVTVVIIMQTFRMVATTVSFPFMMSWWAKRESLYFTGVLDKRGLKNPGGGEGKRKVKKKRDRGCAAENSIAG